MHIATGIVSWNFRAIMNMSCHTTITCMGIVHICGTKYSYSIEHNYLYFNCLAVCTLRVNLRILVNSSNNKASSRVLLDNPTIDSVFITLEVMYHTLNRTKHLLNHDQQQQKQKQQVQVATAASSGNK